MVTATQALGMRRTAQPAHGNRVAQTGTVEIAIPERERKEKPMVLVRRLLGDVLRRRRLAQGRTLREVSAAARVSLGYLSEVERGQKEASSELLASICQALDIPLSAVLREVSDELVRAEAAAVGALADVRDDRSASVKPREVVAA
jgi:transcriptional regulator with XRE-family HTH domain